MLKLEDIAYTVNTLPKAFFIWGILETTAQTPLDMQRKVEDEFPFLKDLSFLKDNNFRQYCKRSLKEWVERTEVSSPDKRFDKIQAFSLTEPGLKPYAALILTKSPDLDANPEDYLAAAGNAYKIANKITIDILLMLYEKNKEKIDKISTDFNLDYTVTYRHAERLEKAGLIKRTVFPHEKDHFGYRWIQGKEPGKVTAVYGMNESLRYLARFLEENKGIYGYTKLKEETLYSKSTLKKLMAELKDQGFVERISLGKYSNAIIQEKGKKVVQNIIVPLVVASEGRSELIAEPTSEQLVKAMEMYEKSLRT